MKGEAQIKSRKRVKNFGEVFTPEWLVKDMCDEIPPEIWGNIDSTFLEPACGNGNFLAEILNRKLKLCKDGREVVRAVNSLYGVDIMPDNVLECRARLLKICAEFMPNAEAPVFLKIADILAEHIICDDFLDPHTPWLKEVVEKNGVTPDKKYIKIKARKAE